MTHLFRKKSRAKKARTGSLISIFNCFADLEEGNMDYGTCSNCGERNTSYNWCQICRSKHFISCFVRWTSGNRDIDKFIRNTQIKSLSRNRVLEWIPYEQLTNF